MKKLLLILLLLLSVSLTSCKKKEIKLTKENLEDYLSVYYDVNPSSQSGSYFTCVDDYVEIKSTSKKAKFENATIYVTVTFSYTVPNIDDPIYLHFNHVIKLNENGYGKDAITKKLGLDEGIIPQTQTFKSIKITRVSGKILK